MVFVAALFVFRPVAQSAASGRSGIAVASVTAMAVLASTGLYAAIGRPDAVGIAPHAVNRPSSGAAAASPAPRKDVAPVGSLVDGLAARLQENPDDGSGWLLLAKSYSHLGRDDDARSAYEKAKQLGFSDDAFESSLADGSQASPANAVTIEGRVSLKGDLAAKDATVFVIARHTSGAAMPLAVLRRPASDLPFEFSLSDANSMVKGGGLSSADTVIVSAKISSTGDAFNTDRGYEVDSMPVSTTDAPYLDLEINPGFQAAKE